jgi:hypothetical protein
MKGFLIAVQYALSTGGLKSVISISGSVCLLYGRVEERY